MHKPQINTKFGRTQEVLNLGGSEKPSFLTKRLTTLSSCDHVFSSKTSQVYSKFPPSMSMANYCLLHLHVVVVLLCLANWRRKTCNHATGKERCLCVSVVALCFIALNSIYSWLFFSLGLLVNASFLVLWFLKYQFLLIFFPNSLFN